MTITAPNPMVVVQAPVRIGVAGTGGGNGMVSVLHS